MVKHTGVASTWKMHSWDVTARSKLVRGRQNNAVIMNQGGLREGQQDEQKGQESGPNEGQQGGEETPTGTTVATAQSSLFIHVQFPPLDFLDMHRLGLTHPHQQWTHSACKSKLDLTSEEDVSADGGILHKYRVLSPLSLGQCLESLRKNGTFCPVAAALEDWPSALDREWRHQREIELSDPDDHQEGMWEQQHYEDPCRVHMVHEHGALLLLACPKVRTDAI
jgi:hypothetical protein